MTHQLTDLVGHHGYLAVFLLMALEAACIPIPSEAVLLFGGALAGGAFASRFDSHLHWWVVALIGVAGDLTGGIVAYGVGRYGGRSLVEHRALSWLVRPHHLEKAESFFERRGSAAVAVGRVLPVVRTFISLPAGIAEMPFGRFVAYTIVGCTPWCFAFAGAGDAIGDNWDRVSHDFTLISVVVAVAAVAALVVWWRRNRGTAAENAAAEHRLADERIAGDV